MKKPKEIRNRIKEISNTKKITKTMDMVATTKFLRIQERLKSFEPFSDAVQKLLETFASTEDIKQNNEFFRTRELKKTMVFLITSNRGLCGSFNTNLFEMTRKHLDNYKKQDIATELHIAGKKGVAFFTFRKYEIANKITNLTDLPTFADAKRFAEPLISAYLNNEADRIEIIFGRFKSMLKQPPTVFQLFPIENIVFKNENKTEINRDLKELDFYKFSPDAKTVFENFLPLYIDSLIYRIFIESIASEQTARRVAMKSATDNSKEIIKNLTRQFNKARQAQITSELTEIISTSNAIE